MKKRNAVNTIQIQAGNSTSNPFHTKIGDKHKSFRMSDVFYKQLVESLNEYCVFTTDKQGVISSWNSGAQKLLGYSEKEIIGKNASIIFTAGDRKEKIPEQELNTAKNKGRALDVRWHIRKDKKKFWGSGLVFPLKNEHNRLLGFTIIMHDLTETRKQELQLKESEAFNKSIFNSSPDCVKVINVNGNLITINEAGIKMMEIDDVNGHIGKRWFAGLNDQYSRDLKKATAIAKKGGVGRFEGVRPTMKGAYKWWDVSVSPLFNAEGKIKQLLSVSRDTTEQKFKDAERKNLIQELERERAKLVEIFEKAPAFLAIMRGKSFVYELANQAYFDLVGKKNIIGKTVLECFPEIKEQGYISLLNKVFTTGKSFIGREMKLVLHAKPKGKPTEKYLNFVYQPTRDKMGRIDGVTSHGFDITEQVMARKDAEEMGERFETMANNIPNLAWIANADGNITWYNNRWYEYTGTTEKDMKNAGWESVHDPENLPAVLEKWKLTIKSGQPFEMVFPLKGADNVFHPFLTRVVPIRNGKGKIIRWFGTNTDITKQVELERMKDDFLGITSHELKTPVTVIKAYTQVLEEIFKKNNDTTATGWLGKMNVQVNKLTALIEDLLDVTKIETGRMQFENTTFDFNNLAVEIVEQIQGTAPHHNLELDLQKTVQVHGDRERLGQVITNFLTNAIKYSPNANKVIVRTKVSKSDVTLSVSDFGLGISKDKHHKVFEQFYRVNDSKQYTFPGIGIGLYISSEIVKRSNGKIWVMSKEGKGSTFYFTIPAGGEI
ncbi:MAG: PAS domain-containing sensor histidine kinase [Ginsengibacter sp.]